MTHTFDQSYIPLSSFILRSIISDIGKAPSYNKMNALPYLVNHRDDGPLPDPTVSDSSGPTRDSRDRMNVIIVRLRAAHV